MTETRIVAFKDGKIHLGPGVSLPMSATNISPAYQPFKSGIYWVIYVIRYDHTSRKLITRLTSYQGPSCQFYEQKPLPYRVDSIIINDITSAGLMEAWDKAAYKAKHPAYGGKNNAARHSSNFAAQTVVRTKELNLRIPFSDLTYEIEGVSFEYAVNPRVPSVKVQVSNPYVRPEFQFIAPYLAKVLKRNAARFNIRLKKIMLYGAVQSISIEKAISPDIDRITADLIENVNKKHVFDVIFKRKNELEDEGILQPVKNADSPLNNWENPRQILKMILDDRESKHHKQLHFLSTRHREDLATLRFTTDPVAFLFLLEGNRGYCFVLEVYNKRLATYIWECEKGPDAIQAKIEELQGLMVGFRNQTRLDYRKSRPEGFSFIEHDYDEKAGFQKWQEDLFRIIGI